MPTVASLAGYVSGAPMLGWAVGWQEIVVIVLVVLILFGGRKIPELARGLGKGLREFKREMSGIKRDFEDATAEAERDDDAYDQPRPKKRRKKPRPQVEDDEESAEASAEEEARSDTKQG